MPNRPRFGQRSAIDWAGRLLIAAILAAIGCTSMARTIGYAWRDRDITMAHALSPNDGRVTALLAQRIISASTGVDTAGRVRADTLARAALREDPTVVVAASTIGIDMAIRGQDQRSRAILAYAQTLSRRDRQTQFWAIQDAVAQGNVNEALRQYDITLRTIRGATDLLYPILAGAIKNPAIQTALTKTLATQPVWGGPFVDYVSGNSPDPQAAASLFVKLTKSGVPVPVGATATIISALVAKGMVSDAWAYYAILHHHIDRRGSRDPNFTANPIPPSLFDWIPINDSGVNASIQRGEHGGIFEYSASSGAGGPAVEQMQVLPPGNYRLIGRGQALDLPEDQRPYWLLSCRDGRELDRVVLANGTRTDAKFFGHFTVPADCPVQNLIMMVRPSGSVAEVSGQIEYAQLISE